MFKDNLKKLFLSLTVLLLALCAINAQANVPDYLSIVGPSQISVGKTNVQYHLSYYVSGIFDGCDFWAKTQGLVRRIRIAAIRTIFLFIIYIIFYFRQIRYYTYRKELKFRKRSKL